MQAKDLTEADIGRRFEFRGTPAVVATLGKELECGNMIARRFRLNNAVDDNDLWDQGYYINNNAEVVPLEPEKEINESTKKLAQYIQQEYSLRLGGTLLTNSAIVFAQIFEELIGETNGS